MIKIDKVKTVQVWGTQRNCWDTDDGEWVLINDLYLVWCGADQQCSTEEMIDMQNEMDYFDEDTTWLAFIRRGDWIYPKTKLIALFYGVGRGD